MSQWQDDALLNPSDAAAIGFQVADMAERVKVGHACLPGTQAEWAFTMDEVRFKVVVTVAPPTITGQSGEGEGGRGPH